MIEEEAIMQKPMKIIAVLTPGFFLPGCTAYRTVELDLGEPLHQ